MLLSDNKQQSQSHSFRLNNLINGSGLSLASKTVLMVGVGGIGCQILKNLCKTSLGSLHILDMDTIQLSNLNRQFLFKQQHRGESKSLTAKQTIKQLNSFFNVQAHHCNIRQLEISFFSKFDCIILALDNVQARTYVNKVAVRLSIPVIDAGTLGYTGNVTTIIPGVTKCYLCQPKETKQQVYPVCTIRTRPDKPIHCVVWAKMLFEAIFGAVNEGNQLNDISGQALAEDEINLWIRLYQTDILNIKNAKKAKGQPQSDQYLKRIKTIPMQKLIQNISIPCIDTFNGYDKKLSEDVEIRLLSEAFTRLRARRSTNLMIEFDKDDDNIIHFIASAANLRMYCFGIETQTFNKVKNMAGNIVPAIASTNSIVSGIQIIEMIKLLSDNVGHMRSYFVQNQPNKILPLRLESPVTTCKTCSSQAQPVIIEADMHEYRLKDLVQLINSCAPDLECFSLNIRSNEIYMSEQPNEMLLGKYMGEIDGSGEMDLILTDEDSCQLVCGLWLVHCQEKGKTFTVIGKEKIVRRVREQKEEEQNEEKGHESNDLNESSDDIVCEDSDQVQIISSRKRTLGQPNMEDPFVEQQNHDLKRRKLTEQK